MIDVRIVYINQVSDYNNLLTFIRKSHINSETVDELKQYLGLKCNKLIVEFPYADKDYLSTFYIHYAKNTKSIQRVVIDCMFSITMIILALLHSDLRL